jgi:hypothetical protein
VSDDRRKYAADWQQRWSRSYGAAFQQGTLEQGELLAADHLLTERHKIPRFSKEWEAGLEAILGLDPDVHQRPDSGRAVTLTPEERDAAKIANVDEQTYARMKLKGQDEGFLPKK